MIKKQFILLIVLSGLVLAINARPQSDIKAYSIADDSAKIQILIDLAKECRYNDPEDLKRYNQEALKDLL